MRRSLFLLFCLGLALSAQPRLEDFEYTGMKDHPVVSRFAGSLLLEGGESGYAEVLFPAHKTQREQYLRVNGKLGWRLYAAPEGRPAVEVMRNYEAALRQAGFETKVACAPQSCDIAGYRRPNAFVEGIAEAAAGKRLRLTYSETSPVTADIVGGEAQSGYVGVRTRGGVTQYVFVAVATRSAGNAACLPDKTRLLKELGVRAYTFVAVVEEKAPETGMVEVSDAGKIQAGLQAEGKIAFYALYFDTGKAELKPESKPQLDAMAQALRANAGFQVWIVGHTDTVGTLDANLDLSRRRAQAVVTALVRDYAIAPARLSGQGAGPLAPVASNAEESGRKFNRRVEMVLRP
jgi:OmpA-OmpF porin, OOP family